MICLLTSGVPRLLLLHVQITFVVMGQSETSMMLGLCRREEETESSCQDGLDNDCDGLLDSDDPDCLKRLMAEE